MNDKNETDFKILPYLLAARIRELEPALIRLVHDKLGIVVHQNQINDLTKVAIEGCEQFNLTPDEYYHALKSCSHQAPILDHLIAGVTIGETYFFRDKRQMDLLKNDLLPNLIEKKRQDNNLFIRIWSAGCSSGEEIYTIAMLLSELLPDIDKWRLALLGTDINTVSLHKAMMGRYGAWSMRSISDYFKKKYFTQEGQQYHLRSTVKDRAMFSYLNLNDDDYPSIYNGTHAQDIIICRNVLIYFDDKHVNRLMKKVSACLTQGGTLMLGASDPIRIDDTGLVFHHEKGIIFTREKVEKQVKAEPSKQASESRSPAHEVKTPVKERALPKVKQAPLTQQVDTTQASIDAFVQQGEWQAVIENVDRLTKHEADSAFMFNAKGVALANLGKLEAAKAEFEASLRKEPTNKDTYYMYAMTLIELNFIAQAEAALRKMLFLERHYVLGHYQLGLLLIRNKEVEQGIKCLKNALTISLKKHANEMVPGPQAVTYGRLVEILRREIAIYSTKGEGRYAYEDNDTEEV